MVLSKAVIAFYLSERGFEFDALVIKSPKNTKNFCFQVQTNARTSFFLKQSKSQQKYFLDEIEREALFYLLVLTEDYFITIRDCVPKFLAFDRNNRIIISELIDNSKNLDKYLKNEKFTPKIVKNLGEMFKKIRHIKPSDSIPLSITKSLSIFNLKESSYYLTDGKENHVTQQFVSQIINNKILLNGLKETEQFWQINGILHGDIKFGNIMIDIKTKRFYVVDWEGVSIGDTYWDIACLVQNIIMSSVFKEKKMLHPTVNILKNKDLIKIIKQLFCSSIDLIDNHFKTKICFFLATCIIQKLIEQRQMEDELEFLNNQLLNLSEDIFNNTNKYFIFFD